MNDLDFPTSYWNIYRLKIISAFTFLVLAFALGIIPSTYFQYTSSYFGIIKDKDDIKCLFDVKNNITKCRSKCYGAEFSLFGMNSCHPWLDCDSIANVHITDQIIGQGAVKMVKLGRWNGHDVAVSFLRDDRFIEDFLFNLQMLKLFNTDNSDEVSDKVVQLIGFCNKSDHLVITEYHPLGSADGIKDIPQELDYFHLPATRFSLCLDFVHIVVMLHNHNKGRRVLCDANDPEKALSQFLLSPNFHLVLNDMDALPIANEAEGLFVKCGHKELFGEFVAPEQIWPYDELPFNDSMMPGYTEKVDIWKIPDIFNYLLNDIAGSNKIKLHLFNIHAKCKSAPDLRPSAKEVFIEYEHLFKKLGYDSSQYQQHKDDPL